MKSSVLFTLVFLGCGSNPTTIPDEPGTPEEGAPPAAIDEQGNDESDNQPQTGGEDSPVVGGGEADNLPDPSEGEGEGEGEAAPCGCTTDEQCQDGNICNGTEVCNRCVCMRTEPHVCESDGVFCTQGICNPENGQCDYVPVHEWCSEGEICDVEQDCVGRPPCQSNDECDSEDPCQSGICDLETGTCVYRLVDADADGFGSRACGGLDCNDGNFEIYPEAPEQCNTLDDDCDGEIDEGFDFSSNPTHCGQCNTACDAHLECYDGSCQCANEIHANCGQYCVNLATSTGDCGQCGNRCEDPLVRCVAGECLCAGADEVFCEGGCHDWRSSNQHCGNCGIACPQGQQCMHGRCG